MFTDRYLRFDNEAQAKSVLYRIEGAVEADPDNGIAAQEGYQVPNYTNIDTIGVMQSGGEWDENGEEVTPPTPIPGWHVNVRLLDGEDGDALAPYAVEVNTPMRKWKAEVSA